MEKIIFLQRDTKNWALAPLPPGSYAYDIRNGHYSDNYFVEMVNVLLYS